MDTKHMEYFKAVYEERSIHAAAKKLFISPQGLGRILKSLEEEFDAAFFVRGKGGVIPTEAGRIFYGQCAKTGDELARMKKQIRRAAEKPGRLRVGFANGVLQLFPIEVLFGFIRGNPDVQVEWCEYENDVLIEKLCGAELDYGLVVGRQADAGLIQSLMCTCPVVLLVYEGHPLYGEEAISLPMLKNEKLIVMNEQFRIYHDFIAACQVEGFTPQIIAKTMDGGTLRWMCMQKQGLAVTPDFPRQQYPAARTIPFLGNYTWDIFGSCLPKAKEDGAVYRLEAYFRSAGSAPAEPAEIKGNDV